MRRNLIAIAVSTLCAGLAMAQGGPVRGVVACDPAGNMLIQLPDGAVPGAVLNVPVNLCAMLKAKPKQPPAADPPAPKERPTSSPRAT